MIGSVFRWVVAPLGLLIAGGVVIHWLEGRIGVRLTTVLSSTVTGLCVAWMLNRRRNSG